MKQYIYYIVLMLSLCSLQTAAQNGSIKGVIKSKGKPIENVQISIEGRPNAFFSDQKGFYQLTDVPPGKLKLYFTAYDFENENRSVQLKPGDTLTVNIELAPVNTKMLDEVVVSGTMKEVSKLKSPIPVEVYTPTLFKKNPSPSIFESLGMINGVQPQLNCNVCNTGDIHINGMEGPYTMILIDGMPIVSSLATVYGLSGIPNSMVKRIEVVKGPASTLYGSEAVGGLVNIITKDPGSSPRFNTDLSATGYGEYNADVAAKFKAGRANALVGVNYFNYSGLHDSNSDYFTDVTLQNRASVFNKWSLGLASGRSANLAVRYVYENRWGGQLNWTPDFRGSDSIYGESVKTNRFELLGNIDLPNQFVVDYSYNYHLQDSYYGINKFYATQQVAFAQLRWSKNIGQHELLAGLPLRYTIYDDNTSGTKAINGVNAPSKTFLPGIFVQDEWKTSEKLSILAGIRYDHHNEHGNIFTPRLSFKYAPNTTNTIRLSAGNGYRVVNLFTEDHAALTGAREVVIKNDLLPERSWNVNLNYSTIISHSAGFIGLDGSVFYTYFTNKITGDFLTDPSKIIYDNLNGYAISKGLTLNTDFSFTNGLKIMLGATYMDVYQKDDINGQMITTPQLFAPKISGTYAVSYTIQPWKLLIDLTGKVNGPMHLPTVPNDFRPAKSPYYNLMNIQLTKRFNKDIEIYGGCKNLLNFVPQNPLFKPEDPFGPEFDTTYNYAPIQGIKGFLGIRYTVK
ncbi:TonB-dependent receptor [Solitalea canadensis]|uniref:Outer membrane receptor for ferrienterochelin and colicins n=1 Tax=Solitalea canadensis (strain ATCC 29591 / DSM 3403 / JCM 21819 / LMG 8368 / NBRC 15130 / NCIMB 12057 / USAM 9D) TaxID=929556 RepID=H8KR53_SOLCM|nr:TonB-dependent receptor [Solitalea canadensis]AFD07259.1 outer membrane receptor for ferrienterochelin and colicins [Solitalea canadensis DSM 3403]